MLGLAMRDVRLSWAAETYLVSVAVGLGAALVGLVALVATAFRAQLDTTVLGAALDTQIRPFHVVLATLTLTLGTAAVAQVTLTAWVGRRRELGMLKALGWSSLRMVGMVCWQALILAAGGITIAVPAVLAAAALLETPVGAAAAAVATSLGACLLSAAGGAIAPSVMALTASARRLLAA
jgi:hypothetical protein